MALLTPTTGPQDDPLKALVSGHRPDVVEIGERNDCWMHVVISKKRLDLIDKETGKTIRIPIDESFAHVAEARHKLGATRIAIALRLVGLK